MISEKQRESSSVFSTEGSSVIKKFIHLWSPHYIMWYTAGNYMCLICTCQLIILDIRLSDGDNRDMIFTCVYLEFAYYYLRGEALLQGKYIF